MPLINNYRKIYMLNSLYNSSKKEVKTNETRSKPIP